MLTIAICCNRRPFQDPPPPNPPFFLLLLLHWSDGLNNWSAEITSNVCANRRSFAAEKCQSEETPSSRLFRVGYFAAGSKRDNTYSYLNECIVLVFDRRKSIPPYIAVIWCWLYWAADTRYWYFSAIFIHECFLYHSNKNISLLYKWCLPTGEIFQPWLWVTQETLLELGCMCERSGGRSISLAYAKKCQLCRASKTECLCV